MENTFNLINLVNLVNLVNFSLGNIFSLKTLYKQSIKAD